MNKIEKIVQYIKNQSFEFNQKIQSNETHFWILQTIVQLLCLSEIMLLTFHQTIIYFNNGIFADFIESITIQGLNIIQAQDYSYIFHLTVSVFCNFTLITFLINIFYKKINYQIKEIQLLIDYMFIVVSLFFSIFPIYYLIMVYHFQELFTIAEVNVYFYINLITLPICITIFILNFFLKRKNNIINLAHLMIPIFDYTLIYNGIWFNFVIMITAILNYFLLKPRKLKFYNVLISLSNIWAISVNQNAQYTPIQQFFLLIFLVLMFWCYFSLNKLSYIEQIQNFEKIIKQIDKPQSQLNQHYIECYFIDHFMNCTQINKEISFCNTNIKCGKSSSTMSRKLLYQFLEQKLRTDLNKVESQQIKLKLLKIQFEIQNPLKIYRYAYENLKNSHNKGYIEVYQEFKVFKQFQKTINKQNEKNQKLLNKISQKLDEQFLITKIYEILELFSELWDHIIYTQQNQVEFKIQQIIIEKQIIEKKFDNIIKNNQMNSYKIKIFELYSQFIGKKLNITNYSLNQIANQQMFPFYLITCQKNIVDVDPNFLVKYQFQYQEIINQNYNILIPKKFQQNHNKIIQNWTQTQLTNKSLKFLINGSGFLQLVNFSIYIHPNSETSLRYISCYEDRNQKYIALLDLKDNKILCMSEGFKDLLIENGFYEQMLNTYQIGQVFKKVDFENTDIIDKLKQGIQIDFNHEKNIHNLIYTIKFIKLYEFENSKFLLLNLLISNHEKKITKKNISAVSLENRENINQQIQSIKNDLSKDSNLTKSTFNVNIIFLVIFLTILIIIYYFDNSKNTQLSQLSIQIDSLLKIRLLFVQILAYNVEIYSIRNLPSNNLNVSQKINNLTQIMTQKQNQLQALYSNRLNEASNYQLLQYIQTITFQSESNNISFIIQNISNISALLFVKNYFALIPPTTINDQCLYENVFISFLICLQVIYLIYSFVHSWQIQIIIPIIKGIFMKIQGSFINQKKSFFCDFHKKLQGIINLNFKKSDMKKGGIQKTPQQIVCSNLIFKNLKLNIYLIIIILISIVTLIIFQQALFQFSGSKDTIIQAQMLKFIKSCQLKSLAFFINLELISKNSGFKLPNYTMTQINTLNSISTLIMTFDALPSEFELSNSQNVWVFVNQNICLRLDIDNCENLFEKILVTGYSKTKTYLQDLIMTFLNGNDGTLNNKIKQYQNIDDLIQILSNVSYLMYTNFLVEFDQYIQNINLKAIFFFVGFGFILILKIFFFYLDKKKKQRRINIIKELFQLIPQKQLTQPIIVQMFSKNYNLLQVIKNL